MDDLQQLSAEQAGKHVTANENFKSVRAAALFGVDYETTEGLTLGIKGGPLWNGSAMTDVADTTVTLTASQTNYVEATTAGVVSSNTSAFTAGRLQLYVAVTGTAGITTLTDYRNFTQQNQHARLGTVESKFGTSTSFGAVPAKANVTTTAVGNVGTGEDNLMTYSLPASALSAAGKGVQIVAWGTTANNGDAKTVKLYFGSVAILTTALTVSQAGVWRIAAEVFSTGTDAQDYVAQLVQGGATTLLDVENGSLTQDDGAAITVKCTGEAVSNDDIKQEGLLVTMFN